MKTKRFLILSLFVSLFMSVKAQIQLTPYVEPNEQGVGKNVQEVVENRLRSIISANGMNSGINTPFVLAAKFNIVGKEIIPGPPMKVVSVVEVTLAVGNGTSNQCFASCTFEVKGAGNTEERAMLSALKSMKTKNADISNLVTVATERIIQYYEESAPKIMATANSLITQKSYDEAIEILSHIPQECSHFEAAAGMMTTAYQKYIDETAQQALIQAKSIWSAADDDPAKAEEAMNIASTIDPNASCYSEALTFVEQVGNRLKTLKDEAIAYERKKEQMEAAHKRKMEEQALKSAAEIQKQSIKAARDVAVARAKNQPKTVYKIYWW
ncbi:MAG: hypothetical protein IKT82_00080 [Bacteroidaceae bacterium]|nr:hypothetical protein [Bacteroidaceae bacterium]